MKRVRNILLLLLLAAMAARAEVQVTVSGSAGTVAQVLPNAGGRFDLSLPLAANAANTLTIAATDAWSNHVQTVINVTQLSLAALVVSDVRIEPLPYERVVELVNEGAIQLDNPANYNVSTFDIVLTIGGEAVPISIPIATPIDERETGFEVYKLPWGRDEGGAPSKPQEREIIVFDEPVGAPEGVRPRIYGVMVIEGRIKSLKEFFSVRLLLMNTSGIFTLRDVQAMIGFPDGGLSATLPADGHVSFGDILPGDGATPGQAEREFIIRGDEMGVRRVHLDFAGTVTGPGLPDDPAIAFNGGAEGTLEVRGPPRFLVQVFHPSAVETNRPYALDVEIQNVGDQPALYASLDLEVGADGLVESCAVDTNSGAVVCDFMHGPVTRTFGHIFPGERVRETFRLLALRSGPITSCLGISDQNVQLQVSVGNIGCLTGHFPPTTGVPQGLPTVSVVPSPNQLGVSPTAPVTAFFSEPMEEPSITTGTNGSFNVYAPDGGLVNGGLRFITIGNRTAAIWQRDGGLSPLDDNTTYSVTLTEAIRDLDSNTLYNAWSSTFRTTSLTEDRDPPELRLTLLPPVNPNQVLPGQTVVVNAYAADQGSGITRVELRMKALGGTNATYRFIDQKTVFDLLSNEPCIFTLDTAALGFAPGYTYQLLGTAYDGVGNTRDATVAVMMAASADPPVIALPPDPVVPMLQGIAVALTPLYVSGGVTRVEYRLDGATNTFSTLFLAPWQTYLSTLALPLGAHTVSVTAVDGLLQTGGDDWVFGVVSNANAPQVSFGSAVDGATFATGTVLSVNAAITDPVGVAGVAFYLDSIANLPLSRGSGSFAVPTLGLSTGVHHVIAVASNVLGVANDPADPASAWKFVLIEPPPGVPPSAPVVTRVGEPVAGLAAFAGATAPNARVDVANHEGGFTVTITADAAGAFAGMIHAAGGETLRFTARDLTQSPEASAPTDRVVPAPTVFTGITLDPAQVTFTAAGQSRDLTVNAAVWGGGTSTVTACAAFSSSAPGIASVSETGRVVAHAAGQAVVTATYGGFRAETTIDADILTLTGLQVEPPGVVLVYTGQTAQLTVRGVYNNGTTNALASGASFGNSDGAVIGVSGGGRITARADGEAQVTVSAAGLLPVAVPVSVVTGLNPAPALRIESPADGATYERGDPVSVTVHAEDPVGGVTRLALVVTGAVALADERQISPPAAAVTRTFVFTIPSGASIGSALEVTAQAQDIGGLLSPVKRLTLGVADRTPPAVALLAPTHGAAYNAGSTVTVAVAVSDAVGVSEVGYATTGAFVLTASAPLVPSATGTNVTLTFVVPPGAPVPDLWIAGFAHDTAGNAGTTAPVRVELTSADITPPATVVTGVSPPGTGTTATVAYQVLAGVEDLEHVALYFRRNGIGTFNRYIDPDTTNVFGRHLPQSGTNGTVLVDTTELGGDGNYEFYSLGQDRNGNVESAPAEADARTNVAAGTVWVTIASNLVIDADNPAYEDRNLCISNAVVTLAGDHGFRNVDLIGSAVLTHAAATLTNEPAFRLRCWTLSVESNASVNVDACGYLGGRRGGNDGSGNTTNNSDGSTYRSGGSHGGPGGRLEGQPNATYGNFLQPADLGSGGSEGAYGAAGGSGGGRIRIEAVHIAADGPMLANGQSGTGYASGSGSGGSIYVVTHTLSGRGAIQVNGGGYEVGAGGGRVAIYYTDLRTKDTARIQALGGRGGNAVGGNGTVFLKGLAESDGALIIDGQGIGSPYTGLPIPQGVVFDDVIIRNNARVIVDDAIVVNDAVQILTGSVLTHSVANTNGLRIRARRVRVDATSVIDVSGKGYRGGRRDGNPNDAGETLDSQPGAVYRAGGSFGGLGGVLEGAGHNLVYGAPQTPVALGGGGSAGAYSAAGGNGGGRVTIDASERVTIHGAILAEGQVGAGYAAGSGAGGSVWITTPLCEGTGRVSVNGAGYEVGGGGGRLAVDVGFIGAGANDFNGLRNFTAYGGKGGNRVGSAGSVYVKQAGQSLGSLYLDEGLAAGTSGLWTPLTPIGPGHVAGLTDDTLTLDGGVAVLPGGLVGLKLRPNIAHPAMFTVVGNTATTLTVDVSSGTNLTAVAQVGDVYAADYTFDNLNARGGVFWVTGDRLNVRGLLALSERAVLTHFDATLACEPGLEIAAGTLTISSNSAINVDGRGYLGGRQAGNDGTGNTTNNASGSAYRSGGSHGGRGGMLEGAPNMIYDDLAAPAELGAGGSEGTYSQPGGDGGGRVHITATALVIDGQISANGANGTGYAAGSGAGGAVYLQVDSVAGAGGVVADGGAFEVGGGGGRVAVRCTTLAMDRDRFSAYGGHGGLASGGHGTVFFKTATQAVGDLVLDGGNQGAPDDSSTIPGGLVFDTLTLRNQANVVVDQPIQVRDALRLLTGSRLSHPRGLEAGLHLAAEVVWIDATSLIDVSGRGYRGGNRDGNASERGETVWGQLGASPRAGGSYGGMGGVMDGAGNNLVYGTAQEPTALGGGGSAGVYAAAGGNGGGRVTITAVDSLTLDGAILAEGLTGNGYQSGSGAGGAVRIDAPLVQGAGRVSANGGGGEVGGGGGRVALFYNLLGDGTNSFGGLRNITAYGGRGNARIGGVGSVYLKQTSQAVGNLYLDQGLPPGSTMQWTPLPTVGPGRSLMLTSNTLVLDGGTPVLPGGLAGVNLRPNINSPLTFTIVENTATTVAVNVTGGTGLTTVASMGDLYVAQYVFDNVYMRGGASVALNDRLVVNQVLAMTEGATLTHFDATLAYEPGLEITAGTLAISSNCVINVNGRGYLGGNRNGNDASGNTTNNADGATDRSGGSHGGLGGIYAGSPNASYDDVAAPRELGAGGAGGTYSAAGGDGGGRVNLAATTLVLDGRLTANGETGSGYQAGSGAGGSINLRAEVLRGSGTVQANGGGSEVGGGGGRVAVRCATLGMDRGSFVAAGGQGGNASGGHGTVFFANPAQTGGDLIIDGQGVSAQTDSTRIPTNVAFDNIDIRNGARIVLTAPLVVAGAVRIVGDSAVTHPPSFADGVRIEAGALLLDSNSVIDVSLRGYRGGLRDGNPNSAGLTTNEAAGATPRSGGSHGGSGARIEGTPNPVYGVATNPAHLGSGGSSGQYSAAGGNGGGRITLMIRGNCVLEGIVRADGGTGNGYAAGSGSGGAVLIRAGLIGGAGTVSAKGGAGELGGGGGRIAVFYDVLSLDTNHVSAAGGVGSSGTGGGGTVYWALQSGGGLAEQSLVFARITVFHTTSDGQFLIAWDGVGDTWVVEGCSALAAGDWQPVSGSVTALSWSGPRAALGAVRFLRVRVGDR